MASAHDDGLNPREDTHQYRGRHSGRSQQPAGRLSPKMIKTRVEIRMARQQLLQRPDPPPLFFILDEAVIQRAIGDEKLGRAQIDRLITTGNRPHITIQIVPFSIGMYVGMAENYTIFSLPNVENHDVLYFESARATLFSHDESGEIITYRQMYEELSKTALSPQDSLAYLTNIAANIAPQVTYVRNASGTIPLGAGFPWMCRIKRGREARRDRERGCPHRCRGGWPDLRVRWHQMDLRMDLHEG